MSMKNLCRIHWMIVYEVLGISPFPLRRLPTDLLGVLEKTIEDLRIFSSNEFWYAAALHNNGR